MSHIQKAITSNENSLYDIEFADAMFVTVCGCVRSREIEGKREKESLYHSINARSHRLTLCRSCIFIVCDIHRVYEKWQSATNSADATHLEYDDVSESENRNTYIIRKRNSIYEAYAYEMLKYKFHQSDTITTTTATAQRKKMRESNK